MGDEKVAEQKAALRQRFRTVRAAVANRPAVDAAIVAGVLTLPEVLEARAVMLFWPLVARGEVDARLLAEALLARGCIVALPVVLGRAPRLESRRFVSAEALVGGPFGLLEPSPEAECVERLDVVVVPALAAGRDGSRLGFGGGYYDAFLPTTAALRVGIVPSACLVETLPVEAHDARLDGIVTERETVRIRA